jgi:hypothetical protein
MNDIAAIKERLSKATPGPWKVVVKGNTVQSYAVESNNGNCFEVNVCSGIKTSNGNAEFIANAPSDIATLLSIIEAQQRTIDAAVSDMQNDCGVCESFGVTCCVTKADGHHVGFCMQLKPGCWKWRGTEASK